jgi:hypothetical protein
MGKPVDQVHGTVDRWRGQVHGGLSNGADTRHDGALPVHGASSAVGLGSSSVKTGAEERG